MSIYRPLDVRNAPDFSKANQYTDILALLDEEEKREAQRMQNDYAAGGLRKQKREQAAADAMAEKWKELRASGEPTVDDMLPQMRDILGETGNVEDALQAQKVIEETQRKDFDDTIQTKRFITQLAKESPEVAQQMWQEYGLGEAPDFKSLEKKNYKSTSGLGIWHVDEDGQIVVDKSVPKQRGAKERVMANPETGEEIVVDISDPQAFAAAQARGFRANKPDSLAGFVTPPKKDAAKDAEDDESWFSKTFGGGDKKAEEPPKEKTKVKPPRKSKPGMKWQYNQKTGQFREVPK